MKNVVGAFRAKKKSLFSYFGCREDYYVKVMDDCFWRLKEEDGVCFLTYWDESNHVNHSVVVKRDGEPLVYAKEDYTMVIGIDCVRLAFVFKSANRA